MHKDNRGRRNPARPDLHLGEAAQRIGIHPGYLSRLLNGYTKPSLAVAEKLAPELGVPLEQLSAELARYAKERKRRRRAAKLNGRAA